MTTKNKMKYRYYNSEPDDLKFNISNLTKKTKANLKMLTDKYDIKFKKTCQRWVVKQIGTWGGGDTITAHSIRVLGVARDKKLIEFWTYYTTGWKTWSCFIWYNNKKFQTFNLRRASTCEYLYDINIQKQANEELLEHKRMFSEAIKIDFTNKSERNRRFEDAENYHKTMILSRY